MYEIWGEIVISIRVLKANIKMKKRLVIWSIFIIWCVYLVLAYACEMKKQGIKLKPVDIDEVNNIFVDGSDITPFIRLMGYGANGLTAFVVSVGYGIATLILSLIPAVLITVIFLKKEKHIEVCEYDISKKIYIAGLVCMFVLSLIITSFTAIIPIAVMILVCAFSGIVYLSKMRGLTE